MLIPFMWDVIDDCGKAGTQTYRAKVFGGWLVKEEVYIDKNDGSLNEFETIHVCMVYIADPNYEWVIDE